MPPETAFSSVSACWLLTIAARQARSEPRRGARAASPRRCSPHVAPHRANRGRTPASAEQRGVREQRHHLPQRGALFVPGGERRGLAGRPRGSESAARRTATASRDRPRGVRHRPRGRSARGARPRRSAHCRSTDPRAGGPVAQRGRTAHRADRLGGRAALVRSAGQGSAIGGQPGQRLQPAGRVELRPARRRDRWAASAVRARDRRPPPKVAAPAACIAARPRPSSSSVSGARCPALDPSAERGSAGPGARRPHASTVATGNVPGLRKPAQPLQPRARMPAARRRRRS